MLKRILVVLDGSETAKAAKRYAVDLAKKKNAELTGLGIIDTPWITAAQPEPLGGAAYKIHRDRVVIRQAHKKTHELLKNFQDMCKDAKLKCSAQELEGFPAMEIETLSQEYDIIVIGKTTDFHFDLDEDTDLTVKHVTHDNPRPLIVATDEDVKGKTVLIAYDGSLQAARALHMYLLLGVGEGMKHHIISIATQEKEANQIVARAVKMCAAHGVKASGEGIASRRAPEKIILEKSEEVKAGMIVMGAFGEQGLKEIFFGSCTEHVMKKTTIPLFIHH